MARRSAHDTRIQKIEIGALCPWLRLAGHDRRFAGHGQYIRQRSAEAGHRDTAYIDTAKQDMEDDGTRHLGDAHPRQGVRVY